MEEEEDAQEAHIPAMEHAREVEEVVVVMVMVEEEEEAGVVVEEEEEEEVRVEVEAGVVAAEEEKALPKLLSAMEPGAE